MPRVLGTQMERNASLPSPSTKGLRQRFGASFALYWQLYVFLLPAVVYFVVFHYLPLYGIQIAFRDYKAAFGITGSSWVGFKHFETFFNSYYFGRLISNTLLLNVYGLLVSFPIPVLLALLLNRVRANRYKRFIQTAIYAPYFVSTVVLAGMLYIFLAPTNGFFNIIRASMGADAIDFMSRADMFRGVYIISGIWQSAGWGTILYLASLTGVDPALYEAAEIDGANIWQKILHIDLPAILPIMAMVFILDSGRLLSSNTDKALLLQTAGNISTSDIIGVYVYNVGIGKAQFSYTAAIGLFTNVINFIIIVSVNMLSKKVTNTSMF